MARQHHTSNNNRYPTSAGVSATTMPASAAAANAAAATGPTFSMDENSSSDNSSPSYYVYQQGKRSSRHNRTYHAGPTSMSYPTARHGIVQQPMSYQAQETGAPAVASYYDGMPAYGESINQMNGSAMPAAASQIYNQPSFHPSGSQFQFDNSGGVCADDMHSYGMGGGGGGGGSHPGMVPPHSTTGMSSDMYGARRRGKFRRQAIRLPDAPPLKQQCRRRLPTPEPDVLERVYIRRIPCKIIEEIIEEPMTPPPRVVEKFINQPPKQNRYVRRIVKVPPRSGFAMYGGGESGSGGGGMMGGQGAFGAGYAPGYGVGGMGGSSYGYSDNAYGGGDGGASSLYDGGSYSSIPQFQSMPSMDYNSAGGIPGYGMQVGSNVMHSSFGNIPSASSNASAYFGGGGGGGGGGSFSTAQPMDGPGAGYDCYPIGQQNDFNYSQGYPGQGYYPQGGLGYETGPVYGGQMQGGGGGGGGSGGVFNNTYQPSYHFGGGAGSGGGGNLNYYSGAPPNLICSLRGSGGPSCPVNLCCYPANGSGVMPIQGRPNTMHMPTGPSIGSGAYPAYQMGNTMPMTIPSGPAYGGMPAPDVGYMPSSTGVQFPMSQGFMPSKPSGNGALICYPMDRSSGGFGGSTGITAFPTYGSSNINMYGANSGGFGSYGSPNADYGSGMGMYGGGSSGMLAAPYSSGSSSFGNFSGYGGSSQPSFQDFSQYGGSMHPSFSGGAACPPLPGANECGGRVFRQIIAMPEPPPEPIYRRQRLPTPPPDIYERVLVCRPPRKVMYNIVEQPTCPPPIVRNQYVMGNPEPPSVMNQTISVPPKSYAQQSHCVNMGSNGLGAYGGGMYCGGINPGMMGGGGCCGMMGGGGCCGMMGGGGCGGMMGGGGGYGSMSCVCMPCQVYGGGFDNDYYGGGYPGGGYPGGGYPGGGYPGGGYPGGGYPGGGYPGGGYPGFDTGYPGIGGGYPGFGDGYPGLGGGYPGMGGGYPGLGGGYPGIGGGYPGLGGGYPGFGGGGGGGGYPGFGGGLGGYPGYGGGLGGYGGGF